MQVISEKGRLVTEFMTDVNGNFEVDLRPGRYVFFAYLPEHGPLVPIISTPAKVTVQVRRVTPVVLLVSDLVPG